ncbi:MAG: cbb3-type cytochrome c oxidase subunit 3 [Gammaproteobacteria bacterium]|nr:MAG: cbb3-type cytochrome c oxidase subunit 3 [Gammaproteobacteria bacterium]
MDAGTWRGIFTVVMLLLFVGICIWAYSSRRRSDFDEAARLPLEPDGESIPPAGDAGRTEH